MQAAGKNTQAAPYSHQPAQYKSLMDEYEIFLKVIPDNRFRKQLNIVFTPSFIDISKLNQVKISRGHEVK